MILTKTIFEEKWMEKIHSFAFNRYEVYQHCFNMKKLVHDLVINVPQLQWHCAINSDKKGDGVKWGKMFTWGKMGHHFIQP